MFGYGLPEAVMFGIEADSHAMKKALNMVIWTGVFVVVIIKK